MGAITDHDEVHQCRFAMDSLQGCSVIHVNGLLDWANAPVLRDLLLAVDGEDRVIVDLSGSQRVDSAGTGVLLGAIGQRRASGRSTAVVVAGGAELAVLQSLGVGEVVPICDSVAAAAEALLA